MQLIAAIPFSNKKEEEKMEANNTIEVVVSMGSRNEIHNIFEVMRNNYINYTESRDIFICISFYKSTLRHRGI